MSSEKSNSLDYLIMALEEVKKIKKAKAYTREIETFDLSSVFTNIEGAKNLASPFDKALIEEFEAEIRKFDRLKMTSQNLKKLEDILRHFHSEVNMAKATQGFSEDEYNKFLKLLENSEIRAFILNLYEGKLKKIIDEDLELVSELKITMKEGERIKLTERGIYLAEALKSLGR
jgi:hypothetical protein